MGTTKLMLDAEVYVCNIIGRIANSPANRVAELLSWTSAKLCVDT